MCGSASSPATIRAPERYVPVDVLGTCPHTGLDGTGIQCSEEEIRCAFDII